MLNLKYDFYTRKNTVTEDKPNEDLVLFNKESNVGLVLDGVSRDRENGRYPNPSPAQIATKMFADCCFKSASLTSETGVGKLRAMIEFGNSSLKDYNKALNHYFPAGVVGVVFSIENDCFHYGYIGDCYGSIIRDGMMRIFTECQTSMVAKHHKEYSADEIRNEICNHVSHPCGYGVWNGDNHSMDFVKYGTISVMHGDVFLIYTDGLKEVIESKKISELVSAPINTICYEEPWKGQDDRACLRIVFED